MRGAMVAGALALAGCRSDLPPSPAPVAGADCAAVAERLRAFQAPPGDAPGLRAQCEGAAMSAADGACLVAARDALAAAACPVRLLPMLDELAHPTCDVVVARLGAKLEERVASGAFPDGVAAAQPGLVAALRDSCVAWPESARRCFLMADSAASALETCDPMLPADVRTALRATLAQLAGLVTSSP